MNARLSVVAATLALGLAAPVAASAQTAPVGAAMTAVEAGPNWQPRQADRYVWRSRDIDSSAKGGNAAQPERLVPQYGNTSGGPAY